MSLPKHWQPTPEDLTIIKDVQEKLAALRDRAGSKEEVMRLVWESRPTRIKSENQRQSAHIIEKMRGWTKPKMKGGLLSKYELTKKLNDEGIQVPLKTVSRWLIEGRIGPMYRGRINEMFADFEMEVLGVSAPKPHKPKAKKTFDVDSLIKGTDTEDTKAESHEDSEDKS